MNFARAFCDSMEWHHRKWWGLNVPQSTASFNAQVHFSGAFICFVIGHPFTQLIGILFLIAGVWCCCRVFKLRTRKHSAAGRTGTALPSKHSQKRGPTGPAADTIFSENH